ncbi:PD-(D/E)XK nuclease family protein, partial [Streptomyces globosus]|uniref:PD-(D/E)XK nuclease family protein n=1 Tax=Streptomyces globosus TaxID=68209 RepID=UPI003818F566
APHGRATGSAPVVHPAAPADDLWPEEWAGPAVPAPAAGSGAAEHPGSADDLWDGEWEAPADGVRPEADTGLPAPAAPHGRATGSAPVVHPAAPADDLWPEEWAGPAVPATAAPSGGAPAESADGPSACPGGRSQAAGSGVPGRAVPAARRGGSGGGPGHAEAGLSPEEARAVASWDRDLDALEGELRRSRAAVRDVELPASLSASQLLRLAADEQGFARDLARPMPRPPQPAARQGTRFHAWVESRFTELPLPFLDVLDPAADLPGSDQEVADEADLAALKEAFERSPYAERVPHRLEVPVQVTLAGRVVRGRIDAVYRAPAGSPYAYEIVDWKTGRGTDADPLQLAVYRLAWAETTGTPLRRVSAAFLHVRSGRVIRPRNLPGRARLERILQGGTGPGGGRRAGG